MENQGKGRSPPDLEQQNWPLESGLYSTTCSLGLEFLAHFLVLHGAGEVGLVVLPEVILGSECSVTCELSRGLAGLIGWKARNSPRIQLLGAGDKAEVAHGSECVLR